MDAFHHLNKVTFSHLRRLYGNFGRNWPHGSREEVKIVKSLQTDRQIDRRTDRQTDGQTDRQTDRQTAEVLA